MSFRQTLPLLTQSKSSKQWISRQFRDPYIKKRLTDPTAHRSRSAFKLLEINDRFGRFLDFKDVQAVVDLGAAPGGWSQVVAERIGSAGVKGGLHLRNADSEERKEEFDGVRDNMGAVDALSCEFEERNYFRLSNGRSRNSEHVKKPVEQHSDPPTISDDLPLASSPSSPRPSRGTVVAVDLLPIDPIPGVHTIRGDFLLGSTTEHIQRLLASKENIHGKADVILSDMAANITGNIVRDIESSLEICEAVFEFARSHLRSAHTIGRRKGGILLVKVFEHSLLNRFRREKLEPNFQHVRYIKPDSSRRASREGHTLWAGFPFPCIISRLSV